MSAFDQAAFDAGLDAYQAQLADEAAEAAERSYETAARPLAVPMEMTFGDLRVGDYMTNEGPSWPLGQGRRPSRPLCYRKSHHQGMADGCVSVLFEIPEPVTVSGETHCWLDRPVDEAVR